MIDEVGLDSRVKCRQIGLYDQYIIRLLIDDGLGWR